MSTLSFIAALALAPGVSALALADDPPADEWVDEDPASVEPAAPAHPLTVESLADGVTLASGDLESGLHVSILSDPRMPVVATQMWVQVGSAHETASEAGFAHLFEHLMFGVTENYGKEDYSRHHTSHGGSENAYTAFDNTVYISEIGPSWHDQVLVFEADRVSNLVLDQDNLDNEKKIVTEELRLRMENNPVARLISPALKALFGDHPYGHTPAGTKEDLANADLELVKKFYEGYYHPANMHLVVVGPVDAEATAARVTELFGVSEKERLVPPEIPMLSDWDFPSERVVLTEDLPPIKVAAMLYVGPTRDSEDYWAYRLMTEMLAGGELDRFREELVTERGKAVEAVTVAEELRSGSILAFASISLPFRFENRAFKLLGQSRDAVGEGEWMSEEVLATAKRRLLRQELERSYYAASQADALGQAYAWQGDEHLALGGAAEAIDAVTLDQVRAAWDTYVTQGEPVELFVKKGKPQEVD